VFRLCKEYTTARYKIDNLMNDFRAFCQKKIENEMLEQEKVRERWSLDKNWKPNMFSQVKNVRKSMTLCSANVTGNMIE
jgi:hypothetical protein